MTRLRRALVGPVGTVVAIVLVAAAVLVASRTRVWSELTSRHAPSYSELYVADPGRPLRAIHHRSSFRWVLHNAGPTARTYHFAVSVRCGTTVSSVTSGQLTLGSDAAVTRSSVLPRHLCAAAQAEVSVRGVGQIHVRVGGRP